MEYFKGVVLQAVNVSLGRAFVKEKISVLEAAVHLDAVVKHCSEAIHTELAKFGVELVNFFFHSINIPDEDASYQRLKVFKEKAAELNVLGRDIYQYDRSMEVLKTAAANEGGGAGLMQAGVGLAVGAGIGQQMMQQAGQFLTRLPEAGTPPPATGHFHVAVNGQPSGPFAEPVLKQMVAAGTLTAASLVWRAGMASWLAAGSVSELAGLFGPAAHTPPTLPPPVPPVT